MRWGVTEVLFWAITIYGFATAVAVLHAGKVLVRAPLEWLAKKIWLLKPLSALVCCPACMAFWTGLALSAGEFSPMRGLLGERYPEALSLGCDGFAALGSTWLLHVAAEKLGHGIEL